MIKMHPTYVAALGAVLALSACGKDKGPGSLAFETPALSTKEALKGKPKTLLGDTDNSLYGFDELRPPVEEDPPL